MTFLTSRKIFICTSLTLNFDDLINSDDGGPSKDFTQYEITKFKIYHGRTKREILSTLDDEQNGRHYSDLIISIDLNGIERILELAINHDLIGGSYFQKTQKNGSYEVHRPTAEELELCHYRGYVRDVPGSWAALSTCYGLKGVIYDGNSTFYLNRGPEEGFTYVYEGKHLKPNRNQSCGFPQSESLMRMKRNTDAIRGPYNANRQSRYVELLLVVDNEEYKALQDLKMVYQHCKDITNIINALFTPLNIFIALIGVVVWTEKDEIVISKNGDETLTNFLRYRRDYLVKEHPNDNAQLLTRVAFDGGVVGKALKGPICTFEYSGGIFTDHSSVVGLVATTVAHELGHNFGMEHDRPECECPDDRCIMASSSSSLPPSHWSSCSLEFLAQAFEHGMDYCLRNKPTKLFDSPICGNGFVEPGEQCDCGLPHRCNNPCCNATTCMLFANASCATGECCDFETCKPKSIGVECRSAEHECDLPEYCTGESEYCPADVFVIDGNTCSNGKAFCYQGKCRSHSDQCQLLWGPSGKNSDSQCYEKNSGGTIHGNCGYNRLNKTYIKCYIQNVYCGMVHCSHLNERLEFGMESVSLLAHSFINNRGKIIPCRTAIVDLGLNEVDPGLAPDGAKCGEGMMCVNQKCMAVEDLKKLIPDSCPKNCSGNGICNSKGHCHCNQGFAPPSCEYPGPGGSTDSGPASDPSLGKKVMIALYIIFLVIIILSVLAFLFIYYTRHNVKIWWKKSPTRHTSAPWECKRQLPARGTSVLLPEAVGIVDVGIIRDRSPGPKATLLNEKQPVVVAPAKPKISDLQSELFVKGKGFTIKPLKKPEESIPNSAPKTAEQNHEKSAGASIPPYVKYEKVNSDPKDNDLTPTIYNNSKSEDERSRAISPQPLPKVYYSNPGAKQKTNFASVKDFSDVVDASMNAAQSSRPKISDPVLEGTTAAELIAEGTALVPTRKAPSVPSANVSDTCTEGYDKELPPIPSQAFKSRPLSSPVEIAEERKLLKELKDSKEYPALTKIASLMKSASISRSSSINEKNKAKVKPEIKKLKFDREKLKNIEISNPIPQVDSSSNAEKESMVMRAQSMREPSQPKPILQSFGSMRVQTDGKRPTSVHVHARPTSPLPRPTSPPPRPPPPKTLATEYSYDDCLNLLAEKNAPLAHIDEENSPTSNIYAVIEDSPKPQRKLNNIERKVRFDDQRHEEPNYLEKEESLTSDAKKSLNSASSGSTESMGLLGEIVSEIQARNLDSIYSSGTLKKKKGSEKEKEREGYDSTNANLFNENLAGKASFESSSNGYPNPKNIDTPNNLEINNSLVKNLNQPKPQMIINDLSKKTNVEDTPKGNQVNVNTYKPYSSSLVRNSGPLSYSYKGKVEPKAVVEKDAKSEFLASQSSEVESSDDNPNTPSSASPFVKSSFTRPPLLGAPTLPKVTPLSITSSFSKDKTDEHESSKAPAKVTKSVSNLTGNSKRTLSSGKNAESNVSSSVASRPASSKFSGISQRPSPSRKGSGTKEDGAVPEPPNRPLPSIPKAEGGKSSKSDSSSAISRPSASSLPRKNSKENLLGKVPGGRKPLTEKKPEIGKLPPKKNSNHISHLQSKFEGNGNVSEIKKSVHQNVSSRPKTAGETKTE